MQSTKFDTWTLVILIYVNELLNDLASNSIFFDGTSLLVVIVDMNVIANDMKEESRL